MDNKIIDYTQFFTGMIIKDNWGNIKVREYNVKTTYTRCRFAFISDQDSPVNTLRNRVYNYSNKGDKIYVTKECRTARDIYRKAGYQIVLDRDKASRVVVPTPEWNIGNYRHDFPVIVEKEGGQKSLILYSVKGCTDDDYAKIMNILGNRFYDYTVTTPYGESIPRGLHCYLVRNYDIYREILNDSWGNPYKFVFETELKIDYPIEISPETLSVWRRATDCHILAKTICMSNWMEYPVTVLAFVATFFDDLYHYGGINFRLVAEQIGLPTDGRYHSVDTLLKDKVAEPKDWNMLQSWLMYELNIQENGGYTSVDKMQSLKELKGYVRTRYVAAPLKINEPMPVSTIVDRLQN